LGDLRTSKGPEGPDKKGKGMGEEEGGGNNPPRDTLWLVMSLQRVIENHKGTSAKLNRSN